MVEIKKVIDGFKHAFAINGAEFEDCDTAILGQLADYVVRRNMSVLAIMFLDTYRKER